nr:MAG TPA: helix-turn-helix domain protein [Caudoviricetes sp.]
MMKTPTKGNSRKQRKVKIKGVVVSVVTISGLADIVGKSRDTLLRYERNGVIPPAFLKIENYRYYPLSLAEKLKPLIARLPRHTKPDPELLVEITRVFNEEINRYA